MHRTRGREEDHASGKGEDRALGPAQAEASAHARTVIPPLPGTTRLARLPAPRLPARTGRLGFEPQSTSLSLARAEFPKVTGAACTCRKPRPVCRARSSPLAEPVGCR